MLKPSTSEDKLDAALAALDQEPTPQASDPTRSPGVGPTLGALDDARRPKASTVCERCPNSVWFASRKELKCYCRVMYLITWSSQEPNALTHCDGQFLGQA